jgi:hypothetical protein
MKPSDYGQHFVHCQIMVNDLFKKNTYFTEDKKSENSTHSTQVQQLLITSCLFDI